MVIYCTKCGNLTARLNEDRTDFQQNDRDYTSMDFATLVFDCDYERCGTQITYFFPESYRSFHDEEDEEFEAERDFDDYTEED